MIHDLNPYPRYKDSGVSWLGQTPEDWDVVRLKTHCPQVNEQTSDPPKTNIYIPLEAVESWTGKVHLPREPVQFDSQVKKFRLGDVLFGKLRPYLAKVARPVVEGVCVSEFLVLRPSSEKMHPPYLELLLRSHSLIDVINSSTFGAKMPRAEWLFIGALRIPLPSIEEQTAIGRYLGYADRRIHRYIRAKRKLIALLNEQRQAIIQQIVFRGLNPNVRLKSSGVEWLGDVPEHWDVKWAKWLFREVDERSAAGSEELLSVSHLTGVTPRSAKNITMFMAESYAGHKLCRPGDLVVNTMWAWMGALGVAPQAGIVSPSYAVYRPIAAISFAAGFVDLLVRLKPYVEEFKRRSTGIRASRLRLYPDKFLRIPLVCPGISEQEEIVAAVQAATAKLSKAIDSASRQIDLLHEYRTRLIEDVVTGKLDVRAIAASLSDEPDEIEGPDEVDLSVEAELDDEESEPDSQYAEAAS